MARRGRPSTAHDYDKNNQCIYCRMYRVNVLRLSHVCTPEREAFMDAQESFEERRRQEEQKKQAEEFQRAEQGIFPDKEKEGIIERVTDRVRGKEKQHGK